MYQGCNRKDCPDIGRGQNEWVESDCIKCLNWWMKNYSGFSSITKEVENRIKELTYKQDFEKVING